MNFLPTEDSELPESDVSVETKKTLNAKPKNNYKMFKKKKIRSGRKCKVCGKDPHPNYFFCPSCHHKVETYEEGDV